MRRGLESLAAPVQPESKLDRAAVGTSEANGSGQRRFETLEKLVAAFRKGVGQVNGHHDRMGFVFDRDDVLAWIPTEGKTG